MGYLRLAEPPMLTMNLPDCEACEREVEDDGYEFKCPSCGTTWSIEQPWGQGALNEKATGPTCPNNWAWRVSHLAGDERDRAVSSYVESHPSVNS